MNDRSSVTIFTAEAIGSSPIEALVLSYSSIASFTTVSNIWTWIAVLTAAVSVWGIKTAALSHRKTPASPKSGSALSESRSESECAGGASSSVMDSRSSSTQVSEAPAVVAEPVSIQRTEEIFTTRTTQLSEAPVEVMRSEEMKFFVYYNETSVSSVAAAADDEDEFFPFCFGGDECRQWSYDGKRLDWSWYCYQDMTVVNGNVVRLWDGAFGRKKWRS